MLHFLQQFFWGAVVGVPAGIVAGLLVVLLVPRKKCPDCGARLPKMRNNWSSRKVIWNCPQCGCGVDGKGRKVDE
jgi:hypothetical protein